MAVMAGVLNETQRRTLEALCDTVVPAVEYDGDDETMRAFMARSASDMAIAAQIEGLMAQAMMPEDIAGFAGLLDGLAQADLASLPLEARTAVLKQVAASAPEAKLGVKVFKNLTLLFFYALPDEQGRNPNWATIVNYMNCIRTPEHIRQEWAGHGIEGMDELEYEQHLDAVWDRLSVNVEATSQNRPHRKLIQAMEASGFPWKPITRNADKECDDPRVCGYCYSGCQRGCKQSTMKTYLQDASDAGARFVVGARAERVLADDGRATGVEATVTNADGSTTKLLVSAPTVVVACGSVESPALLLRSAIGGPAAGKHLRLHPALIVEGLYEEPIEPWIGQAQSAVSYQFADAEDQWGFLIESAPSAPAVVATSWPFVDGAEHKRDFAASFRHSAPFITVARDHGEGEVAIDQYGRAVVRWSLSDEVDRRLFVRGNVELAKLHKAAGAKEILTFHADPVRWCQGGDFDEFLGRIENASYDANDVAIFTAHQLCSCRMGTDPSESVADGRGELHDTKGVWIGDASAFPTAPGVNPMISIMSLAHRTSAEILKAA